MASEQPATGASEPPRPLNRPSADVVIPFRGGEDELDALLETMQRVALGPRDTMTVVDNRPGPARPPRSWAPSRRVLVDGRAAGSYFARNRGAEGGAGEWLVFIDADVRPPGDLLERYFERPPSDNTAVLAGGVRDEPTTEGDWRHPAARYTHLKAAMSQDNTLRPGRWAYAQTANAAVRRSPFEQVGGFTENVRSGGDADLCFRLRDAGWQLEARPEAEVIHRGRPTLRAMLRQRARHGSGARWLDRRYPGAFPRQLSPGTLVWSARQLTSAGRALARPAHRDDAVLLGVEVLSHWAFELGRLAPNEITLPPAGPAA